MADAIREKPVTRSEISEGLRNLGVKPGMTILVHSSMKSFGGWVPGGPPAVVLALQDVIGPDGTLVMPTQSMDLTDPSTWMNPPADPQWWDLIRDEMPAYDPDVTETAGMGAIVDAFRQGKNTCRSRHPHVSFAASGPLSSYILEDHSYDYGLGEQSPLGRLYELGAHVVLLGCGHGRNTSFHLAEYRANFAGKEEIEHRAPVLSDGVKQWITYQDYNICSDDFQKLGADYESSALSSYTKAQIRWAPCFMAPQRALVDYGTTWLSTNRKPT
ncbi:AAC(3) family N-acetyltransferase [Paenibacillus sp. Marseille-Q4541]|uniref:aminoglycoside N(3)-acetyltransferase n=1 Tax=Paenibacillus sp. Marseille-Q4541 TaxID=2831522 RepID=UPI001BA942D7|nr:AAC(3) family N-acetyltransferase [Paenibacillus sp. Marseille-Q4541]